MGTSDVTRILVGTSADADPHRAAEEAVGGARATSRHPVVGLVFATPQYDPDGLAAALDEAFGDIPWAGCSAVGVFADLVLLEHGIVVAIFDSPAAQAQVGVASNVAERPRVAGRLAVARALHGMPVSRGDRQRLMLVLPDTRTGSTAELVRGALREAGNGVVWAGGGAGDVTGTRRLVQFAQGVARQDSVVAVAIDLPGPACTGVRHGWRPFGAPAMVTRALGNVALELEYRSAAEVYRDTAADGGIPLSIDDGGGFAMTHPLGIPQANEHYLVRDPVSVVDGGLRCVAEVPDGALVRLMRADRSDIVAAAGMAAEDAMAALLGDPAGALVFDCMSRHQLLGSSFVDELVAFRDAVGEDVPVFGCLTFGEIAAFDREVPQFHNKTTVVVAIPR